MQRRRPRRRRVGKSITKLFLVGDFVAENSESSVSLVNGRDGAPQMIRPLAGGDSWLDVVGQCLKLSAQVTSHHGKGARMVGRKSHLRSRTRESAADAMLDRA